MSNPANQSHQDDRNTKPVHLAIIMDGNTRWAKRKGLEQISGHQEGALKLRKLIEYLDKFPQIAYLTVFAFSSENWKRSATEVNSLMQLFYTFLKKYKNILIERQIRMRVIGKRNQFKKRLLQLIEEVEQETIHFDRHLVLAVDYGGKWDIANATKKIAAKVKTGAINIEDVDEDLVDKHTAIADIPAPDLLIRTGGEQRISNFLLWQIAYTEFFFTDTYWPDFNEELLREALNTYWGRNRRFGKSGIGNEYQLNVD